MQRIYCELHLFDLNQHIYIVDTDTLYLKPIEDGQPEEEKPEEEDSDDGTSSAPVDPGAGIHVTEAEHKYDDPYSIQSTTFVIKNNNAAFL